MELLLNLAWFIIALVAICLVRGDWRRRKGPRLHEWVALATFLFLLFPVISLTDDLHPEIALAEAATGKKHFHLISGHGQDSQHQPSHTFQRYAAPFGNQTYCAPGASSTVLIERTAPFALSDSTRVTSDRSPPSKSL